MGTKTQFPYTNVPITGSNASAQNSAQKVLVIGQAFEGTIVDGQWYRNVPNDESEFAAVVGRKSMAFQMLRDIKDLNKSVQIDFVAVADGSGATAATADIAFIDEDTIIEITSLSADGTNATVITKKDNFLSTGDTVTIAGSSEAGFNVTTTITVVDSRTFTFTSTVTGTDNGSAVVTGPNGALEAGEFSVHISSNRRYEFTVPVAKGSTASVVSALLETAINESTDAPFTALNSGGTVVVTTTNKGKIYNETPLLINPSYPAGLKVTPTKFANGSVDPDLDSTLDTIGDQRYQTIVWPYNGDIDIVQLFLDSRFNADGEVLDGVAITGKADTFANLLTLGNEFNSNSVVVLGSENNGSVYNDIVETPWSVAAIVGAIRSLRLEPNANIAQYVITNGGSLDVVGGPALASRPYANTPVPLLVKSLDGEGFDKTEIKQLNDAGITVLGNNKAGNGVIMGQVVTTYKNDAAGNADITYKFLNYVDTASTGREFISDMLQADNAQSRLTSGNLVKNRTMTNSDTLSAKMVGYYQELADSDYVVARKGEDELAYFKENLSVVTDLETGSATIVFSLPIMTQLRSINAPMQLAFNLT